MRLRSATCLLFSLLCASIAHAGTVTDLITFSVNLDPNQLGPAVLSGSYTLTFDPTQTYINQTSGLTVNSFSYSFPGPIVTGFIYDPPTGSPGDGGEFVFGGLVGGVNVAVDGFNDYFVSVQLYNNVLLARAALSAGGTTQLHYDSGVATITPVPEPRSLSLLAIGLLFAACTASRRPAFPRSA